MYAERTRYFGLHVTVQDLANLDQHASTWDYATIARTSLWIIDSFDKMRFSPGLEAVYIWLKDRVPADTGCVQRYS